jgi:Zn-dependent protease with chaperone function
MKISTVFLSGLLITSHLIASETNHGVYYAELKALKEAPETKLLFQQDVDGGSRTNQCNLLRYKPVVSNNQGRGWFACWEEIRKELSLGAIKREIMRGKNLSFIDEMLLLGLCGANDDLIIVTDETMPALYNYVCSVSKKAKIATPFVFVTLREGFFSAFSRKILAFRGSVVIGQQLLQDLSDEELETLVAQQVGHIKYNHTNKDIVVTCAVAVGAALLTQKNCDAEVTVLKNPLFGCFVIPAFSSLLISKRFEKQADAFALQAGKANGIIKFYERLQQRDQARVAEFNEISNALTENAADIPMLSYLFLNVAYYMAKAEHCVAGAYNKIAYPSHQERIDAATTYLAQQEA